MGHQFVDVLASKQIRRTFIRWNIITRNIVATGMPVDTNCIKGGLVVAMVDHIEYSIFPFVVEWKQLIMILKIMTKINSCCGGDAFYRRTRQWYQVGNYCSKIWNLKTAEVIFPGWLNAPGVYFKADCILETNFTFPEQSETALWDTIEDHKQ